MQHKDYAFWGEIFLRFQQPHPPQLVHILQSAVSHCYELRQHSAPFQNTLLYISHCLSQAPDQPSNAHTATFKTLLLFRSISPIHITLTCHRYGVDLCPREEFQRRLPSRNSIWRETRFSFVNCLQHLWQSRHRGYKKHAKEWSAHCRYPLRFPLWQSAVQPKGLGGWSVFMLYRHVKQSNTSHRHRHIHPPSERVPFKKFSRLTKGEKPRESKPTGKENYSCRWEISLQGRDEGETTVFWTPAG